MAERRPLTAGLKTTTADPVLEKQFVYQDKAEAKLLDKPIVPPAPSEKREGKGQTTAGKLPLTTRVRADYASALKRASLERQLAGQEPNTLQDILEDALEPWLRTHGYIP